MDRQKESPKIVRSDHSRVVCAVCGGSFAKDYMQRHFRRDHPGAKVEWYLTDPSSDSTQRTVRDFFAAANVSKCKCLYIS